MVVVKRFIIFWRFGKLCDELIVILWVIFKNNLIVVKYFVVLKFWDELFILFSLFLLNIEVVLKRFLIVLLEE